MKILTYREYTDEYGGTFVLDSRIRCLFCKNTYYLKDMIIVGNAFSILKFCSEECMNIYILQRKHK
jgi:hypothetical protein